MLREELLRSKNDEIARCLLTRKRKLSELYFATVGLAGAIEGSPADPLYQQKEQAFLDANDLSKGHYFNQGTLPPLPDYASLLPHPQGKEAVSVVPEPRNPKARKATDADSPSNVEAGVSSQAEVATVDRHHLGIQPQTPGRPSSAVSGSEGLAPEVPQALHGPTQTVGVSVPSSSSKPGKEKKAKAPVPETPHNHEFKEQNHLTPGQGTPVPTGGVSTVSAEEKQNKRPSLVVGPPPHAPNQPLSPVSSVEPYSSNTPVPLATSPDTSPAEEVTDAVEKFGKKSRDTRPSLVPSTPDEQLRLEEAQSLAAAKSISDDFKNGVYPSSNEVIQESVTATPTSHKDKTEGATEPALSPLPSETKKPDEVTGPSIEPLTQARHPTEPVKSHVDVAAKKASPVPEELQQTSVPQPVPYQPERMTTRVSSGAIRHKPVSEILGEMPQPAISEAEKTTPTRTTPVSLDKASPASAARIRFKDRKERERERSKRSTVVFPRQQPEKHDPMELVSQNADDIVGRVNEEQDYLFTLFQNKAYSPPRGVSLSTLLASAHKTLSTTNHFLEYQEQMDCRTLRRIYALQNANKWPLRQLKRSVEPPRHPSHLDVLLDHMKWMRTDFREERKWKIAAAKSCADWCAEYVNSDPEHRAVLRIRARVPPLKTKDTGAHKTHIVSPTNEVDEEMLNVSHPTPELVPSTEDDSVVDGLNEEPHHDIRDTIAPAAIFSLGPDEFNFSLDMTPVADKLLGELPVYTPVTIAPDTNMPTFKTPPDSAWKTELLPVSKFATGHIEYHEDEPVRKRSRYDYSQYDREPEHRTMELPPEQTNVALFRAENRPIRERIHPGQSFRPPTEQPMPSVGFFESRQSSQWTYAEDDELRRLVKEYSYNWSLISSCLSPPSQFTSGAERRTPWECFERWIGLEGLPADMSKTQYFRAYCQRLETAQRNVLAQQQAAQQQQQQQIQQQGNNPQSQPLFRRRTTQPLRVDRRGSSRHFAMLDAMRKLAKKRETILQKQQHASHLASLRKVNEVNHPKPPISSPAEFSRLKYERELKLQERQEQYRQQMLAQQRASLAAQRAGQIPNQQAIMNGSVRHPNGAPHNPTVPNMPGGTPSSIPNGLPHGVGINQTRPTSMQGMPGSTPVNGALPHNAMAMKMVPQSGMQQVNGARPGIPMQAIPDSTRVIREANRLQEQQRILQSRQQQPQQPQQQFHNQQQFSSSQGSNSPNMGMPNVNGTHNSPAMMTAFQAAGGMQSPSPFHNGSAQNVSTPSPRMGQPNPLSSGVVPTISSIQSQIQRSHPNMPPEQVNKLSTERLHQYQQQRMSQVAMNAAAGNLGTQANYQTSHDANFQSHPQSAMPNNGPGMQIQGYSPVMRAPQNAQQNHVSVGNSPQMNGTVSQPSRSATPQTQPGGSVQSGAGPGSNKSPRPPQAQMASS